jgi:hypothetical protein
VSAPSPRQIRRDRSLAALEVAVWTAAATFAVLGVLAFLGRGPW